MRFVCQQTILMKYYALFIWKCPLLQIIGDALNACHTRRHFHVLPRSCLIFQSTVRTLENHDIFREKFSVTASLQRPRCCHGALMVFYCVPTVFMVEILCTFTVLSLRVHGAHSSCPALSRRCHCADTVLKMQWQLQEGRAVSVQMPQCITTTAFAQRPLCGPTELLLGCRRPYCTAMVTLLRPLCALLGYPANTEWQCFCLEYAQSVHRRSAFYATPRCPMAMPLRWCLRSYCWHLGVLQFFRTPWDHHEEAALVWQGF